MRIASEIGGFTVHSVTDLETGEPLQDQSKFKAGLQTPFYIPPRDFRLLLLK